MAHGKKKNKARAPVAPRAPPAPAARRNPKEPPCPCGCEIFIEDYAGGVERLREWNKAWELSLRYHYKVVDGEMIYSLRKASAMNRTQMLAGVLDESAFAAREARRTEAAQAAEQLLHAVCYRCHFLTEVIEPWKAMHVAEREVKLLEAMRILHQSDTFLGEERRSAYNSERRLVPEITLKNLAGDDGQGFLTLINALLPDPDRVDQYRIVRNAEFEAHYGINFESDETIMPPSQSERAYQETRLHLRHLYLLEFVRVIVARLHNRPPGLRHTGLGHGVELPVDRDFYAICCRYCRADAGMAFPTVKAKERERLFQRCSRCRKVDRVIHYCSPTCQMDDWPEHKRTCGKLLSETVTVPIFNSVSLSTTVPLNPFVALQMLELSRNPTVDYFYFFPKLDEKAKVEDYYVDIGGACLDERQRRAMTQMRLQAMKTRDPYAVGCIISFAFLSMEFSILAMEVTADDPVEPEDALGVAVTQAMFEYVDSQTLGRQLMAEYELSEEELQKRWADVERGTQPAWFKEAKKMIDIRTRELTPPYLDQLDEESREIWVGVTPFVSKLARDLCSCARTDKRAIQGRLEDQPRRDARRAQLLARTLESDVEGLNFAADLEKRSDDLEEEEYFALTEEHYMDVMSWELCLCKDALSSMFH